MAVMLALCGLLLVAPVKAVNVQGLYTGTTTVTSRTSEQERRQASAAILRQVLIKVTGRTDILDNADIRRALSSPQQYVESLSYSSVNLPERGSSEQIQVKFYESEVQSLLERNGIPLWPQNRPLTLVWVIAQDASGRRAVVGNEEGVQDQLTAAAAARGMPLLFPLLDLQDRRAIDSERLWNLDAGHIDLVSRRYGAESVLVLRYFSSLGDEYLGRSLFSFRGQELVRDLYGDSLEALVSEPVGEAAEQLAAYYGVLISGTSTRVPVELQVDGIDTLDQYAALLRYVENLADVSGVTIASVQDATVHLRLQTGGQIRQLIESIALDRSMQPITEATRSGETVSLHYQWRL